MPHDPSMYYTSGSDTVDSRLRSPTAIHRTHAISPPSSPPPRSPLPPLPIDPTITVPVRSIRAGCISKTSIGSDIDDLERKSSCLPPTVVSHSNASLPNCVGELEGQNPSNPYIASDRISSSALRSSQLYRPRRVVYRPSATFNFTEEVLTALPEQYRSLASAEDESLYHRSNASFRKEIVQQPEPYLYDMGAHVLVSQQTGEVSDSSEWEKNHSASHDMVPRGFPSIDRNMKLRRLRREEIRLHCLRELIPSLHQFSLSVSKLLKSSTHPSRSHHCWHSQHVLKAKDLEKHGSYCQDKDNPAHALDISHSRLQLPSKALLLHHKVSTNKSREIQQSIPVSPHKHQIETIGGFRNDKPLLLLDTACKTSPISLLSQLASSTGRPTSNHISTDCLREHAFSGSRPSSPKVSNSDAASPQDSQKALFGGDLEADDVEKSIFKSKRSKIMWAIATALLVLIATAGILAGLIWKLDDLTVAS